MRSGVLLSCLAAGVAASACGDDIGPAIDAGAPPQLEIETPPGDEIGLAPGDSIDLKVRLFTAEGMPIGGAPVQWTLMGGAAGTGGATLAVATGATDHTGRSSNTLTAGPARVDFHVVARSGDAP